MKTLKSYLGFLILSFSASLSLYAQDSGVLLKKFYTYSGVKNVGSAKAKAEQYPNLKNSVKSFTAKLSLDKETGEPLIASAKLQLEARLKKIEEKRMGFIREQLDILEQHPGVVENQAKIDALENERAIAQFDISVLQLIAENLSPHKMEVPGPALVQEVNTTDKSH